MQIQMLGNFGQTKTQNKETHTKKIKNVPSFNDENEMGLTLTRKKSLIDCFHFVGAINRKDSNNLSLLRKQSTNRVLTSSFGNEDEYDIKTIMKEHSMDIEQPRFETLSQSSEEDLPRDIRLVKRVTMINASNMEIFPKLFRCNSGINVEEVSEADEQKYGDNIYLEQINALRRRNTGRSKENDSKAANSNKGFRQNYNRKTYEVDSDSEEQNGKNLRERLLKDYEVSSSLHAYSKHHENYLCLNKLQRIFYYVKKINFSTEYPEEDVFELCQLQTKLYNRDDESHMLRFYQSWEEEDCVYLVFETASTSLQQKLQNGIKLRENQIWSLLADCSAALTWMKREDEYHLNIKPGNILRCREKFKLSDPFLNGQILSKALSVFKGQEDEEEKLRLIFSYSAPQILEFKSFVQGLQYQKCDVFSLGLCILENVTGISLNILRRDLKNIRTNKDKYLKGYSPMLKNLLTKMVSLDPHKRPTPEQINNIRKLQLFTLNVKKDGEDVSYKKRKLSL